MMNEAHRQRSSAILILLACTACGESVAPSDPYTWHTHTPPIPLGPIVGATGLYRAQSVAPVQRHGCRIIGWSSDSDLQLKRSRPRRALDSLALRLSLVSHSPFQLRRLPCTDPRPHQISRLPVGAQAANRKSW